MWGPILIVLVILLEEEEGVCSFFLHTHTHTHTVKRWDLLLFRCYHANESTKYTHLNLSRNNWSNSEKIEWAISPNRIDNYRGLGKIITNIYDMLSNSSRTCHHFPYLILTRIGCYKRLIPRNGFKSQLLLIWDK